MDQQQIIADIEARASDAKVTIRDLCEQAGIASSTFSRWKRSDKNPEPIGATLTSLRKLEGALQHFERGEAA